MPHTATSTSIPKRSRRSTATRIAAVAALASAGLVASAASSTNADGVPAHDHFKVMPDGTRIQIGPHVCDHPDELHGAFHNFHAHVHTGAPTKIGGMTIAVEFCE